MAGGYTWERVMSDAVHPNLHGHQLIAREVATTILGRPVAESNSPWELALPWTRARVQAGRPLRVLAMTPFDAVLRERGRSGSERGVAGEVTESVGDLRGRGRERFVVGKRLRQITGDLRQVGQRPTQGRSAATRARPGFTSQAARRRSRAARCARGGGNDGFSAPAKRPPRERGTTTAAARGEPGWDNGL